MLSFGTSTLPVSWYQARWFFSKIAIYWKQLSCQIYRRDSWLGALFHRKSESISCTVVSNSETPWTAWLFQGDVFTIFASPSFSFGLNCFYFLVLSNIITGGFEQVKMRFRPPFLPSVGVFMESWLSVSLAVCFKCLSHLQNFWTFIWRKWHKKGGWVLQIQENFSRHSMML